MTSSVTWETTLTVLSWATLAALCFALGVVARWWVQTLRAWMR